jgi:hypothetical protein
MLWSRNSREARRQKVLDELLEVEPADRLTRLQEAVAAGDVRANEVDQALRLVERLDALRVMTIPHVAGGFRAAHAADLLEVGVADQIVPEAAASEVPASASPAGGAVTSGERRIMARKGSKAKAGTSGKTLSRTTRRRAAIAIVREPEAVSIQTESPEPARLEPEAPIAVDPQILAAQMPIDALEAAARFLARDLAARKVARMSAVPRRRGHRSGADESRSAEPVLAAAGGQQADPAGPTIDWLRP